jgi:nucleoside-diphosphate kinase
MNRFLALIVVILLVFVGAFFFYQKKLTQSKQQQTFAMIKPDAVAANVSGQIIAQIEAAGLQVVAMKMTRMSMSDAEQFYLPLKDRPFYSSLAKYMSSGPIIVMVLEGENAISSYRQLMGATDPQKAAENSLRKRFGKDVEHNAVHGSDSADSAKKEIAFFFTDNEIFPRSK